MVRPRLAFILFHERFLFLFVFRHELIVIIIDCYYVFVSVSSPLRRGHRYGGCNVTLQKAGSHNACFNAGPYRSNTVVDLRLGVPLIPSLAGASVSLFMWLPQLLMNKCGACGQLSAPVSSSSFRTKSQTDNNMSPQRS